MMIRARIEAALRALLGAPIPTEKQTKRHPDEVDVSDQARATFDRLLEAFTQQTDSKRSAALLWSMKEVLPYTLRVESGDLNANQLFIDWLDWFGGSLRNARNQFEKRQ